jgi:hypothetical protein
MSVLDNLTKKVTDTAKAAAKKSGSMVEVTRLNMNIGNEEDRIRKIYTEIGKIIYDEYSEGETIGDTLVEQCRSIDSINKNIEEMKQKILELRNVKACPGCSIELEMDMAFCYKCGRKQDIPISSETCDKC